ncbi:hypothetical protein MTO96_030235 [Rhipicephalus appendiculatus]
MLQMRRLHRIVRRPPNLTHLLRILLPPSRLHVVEATDVPPYRGRGDSTDVSMAWKDGHSNDIVTVSSLPAIFAPVCEDIRLQVVRSS